MEKKITRKQALDFLLTKPYLLGRMVGFDKLTELHNEWLITMVRGTEDDTLQGHRGSYKTTTLSVALALIIILLPSLTTAFIRKTDSDVKEIIAQVKKILLHPATQYFVEAIYGKELIITKSTENMISTNLFNSIKGGVQLVGFGIGGSVTGKHYDRIFTDDIVNKEDRISRAEREKTKLFYQELINIKNRGGRIFNTGTPWHKEDCFTLMPEAKRYDCYTTGLITPEQLEDIKSKMTSSLFCANYELKHVADEDVIFSNPNLNAPKEKAQNGISQLDSAYDGEDYTALSIVNKIGTEYYVYGKCWRKNVIDCEDNIVNIHQEYLCRKLYNELNADKGMVARDLRKKGITVATYTEKMNKYVKITTYLKAEWPHIHFVEGTDDLYIQQILDFNENAEHDDCPDSLASAIRQLWNKKQITEDEKRLYPMLY